MNADLTPLQQAADPLWQQIKALFAEHSFITIVCGFFAVLMVISFYRFLKNISPALVGFVMLLMVALLILHWTQTRTEPELLKPFIDGLAPFFPSVPTPPAKA